MIDYGKSEVLGDVSHERIMTRFTKRHHKFFSTNLEFHLLEAISYHAQINLLPHRIAFRITHMSH